jgi:hypothetical protein
MAYEKYLQKPTSKDKLKRDSGYKPKFLMEELKIIAQSMRIENVADDRLNSSTCNTLHILRL